MVQKERSSLQADFMMPNSSYTYSLTYSQYWNSEIEVYKQFMFIKMEDFDEMLIMLVKENDILYKLSHKYYKNNKKRGYVERNRTETGRGRYNRTVHIISSNHTGRSRTGLPRFRLQGFAKQCFSEGLFRLKLDCQSSRLTFHLVPQHCSRLVTAQQLGFVASYQ